MDQPVAITGADLTSTPSTTQGATLIDKGGYTLELKGFDKATEAGPFSYYTVQYTAVEKAVEKLGKDAVLAALNSALTSSLRVKAKSQLPEKVEGETPEARKAKVDSFLTSNGPILLSEQDAENFIPGTREKKDTVASLQREAKEALEAGNRPEARRLMLAAQELLQAQMAALGPIEDETAAPAAV